MENHAIASAVLCIEPSNGQRRENRGKFYFFAAFIDLDLFIFSLGLCKRERERATTFLVSLQEKEKEREGAGLCCVILIRRRRLEGLSKLGRVQTRRHHTHIQSTRSVVKIEITFFISSNDGSSNKSIEVRFNNNPKIGCSWLSSLVSWHVTNGFKHFIFSFSPLPLWQNKSFPFASNLFIFTKDHMTNNKL